MALTIKLGSVTRLKYLTLPIRPLVDQSPAFDDDSSEAGPLGSGEGDEALSVSEVWSSLVLTVSVVIFLLPFLGGSWQSFRQVG